MGRIPALILLAAFTLAACGVGGPPEHPGPADPAVDLTGFWQQQRR